jgi:hypothetical protein
LIQRKDFQPPNRPLWLPPYRGEAKTTVHAVGRSLNTQSDKKSLSIDILFRSRFIFAIGWFRGPMICEQLNFIVETSDRWPYFRASAPESSMCSRLSPAGSLMARSSLPVHDGVDAADVRTAGDPA